jgi:hypothetical protein
MKFSTIKTSVGLKVAGAVLALMGGVAPLLATPAQAAPPIGTPSGRPEHLYTMLNADTAAANIRSGPGLEFEVLGTVSSNHYILVTGRAEDSNWLQVKYKGETGWLAGDLVRYQQRLSLLPVVDTAEFAAQTAQEQQPAEPAQSYSGIGGSLDFKDGLPAFSAVYTGYPAHYAGVKADDIILKVDGEDVTGLSLYEVANRIKGEAGSTVQLTLLREETDEVLELPIVRGEITYANISQICKEPIRGFGKVWREHPEVHPLLGCPFINFRRDEHATRAAAQTFEHGWMLWLETDTVANVDPIYVFYEDDGTYTRYDDRPLADAHSYAPTPGGFYKVGDRFAKIYWEEIGAYGRYRLGYATNEAHDSLGAFQEFENGRMFWAGEADTIYIIYQGYTDSDGDGIAAWTQGWTSFEDTFEEEAME